MRPLWPWVTLLVSAYLALSALIYWTYTSQRDAVADFYIEWVGSRVALSGEDPYRQETTDLIQLIVGGRPSEPGEDQIAFAYPYYRVFLNAPLANLPYAWASAFWLGFMVVCLIAGFFLTLSAVNWQPRLAETIVLSVMWFFTFSTFGAAMLGQMAGVAFALLCVVLWAANRNRMLMAGMALALSTLKPQLAALIVPIVVLWWLQQRNWHAVAGFGLTLGSLAGASFLILPSWLGGFWRVMTRYPSYKDVRIGPEYLIPTSSPFGQAIVVAVIGVLAWWLIWAWRDAIKSPRAGFTAAAALTMVMTCVILPQTNIVNWVVCLPAIVLILRDLPRSGPWQRGLWVLACLAVLILPWVAYAAFWPDRYDLLISLPPLVVLVAMAAWYKVQRESPLVTTW